MLLSDGSVSIICSLNGNYYYFNKKFDQKVVNIGTFLNYSTIVFDNGLYGIMYKSNNFIPEIGNDFDKLIFVEIFKSKKNINLNKIECGND